MTSPTDRADGYWAAVFRSDVTVLRQPGFNLTFVDDSEAGIYVLSVGDAIRVRAPEALRQTVLEIVDELPLDEALDAARWRDALSGTGAVVMGPAAHFLAHKNVGPPSGTVAAPSWSEVERMVASIPREEVDESGVLEPDIHRIGLWQNGELVAVSTLSDWVGGQTDVGLLVAPDFRGRGLGRAVAAVALNEAIRCAGIARWRCREDNAASMALAADFELQPYGRNLGIRLAPSIA